MANTSNPPEYSASERTHTASENENSTSWMDALYKTENSISVASHLVDMEQFRDVQFLGERFKENPEEIDLTTSNTDRNPNDKTEDGSVTEDPKSLMAESFQTDASFSGNQGQFPHSPVKVDKIVLSTIKKLDNRFGSTLSEIRKYIYSNCDVDFSSIEQDIRQYLRNAVTNGVLIKADQWRYSVPLPKTRRNKAKASSYSKKPAYGKPKKPLPEIRQKAKTYSKKPTNGKPTKPRRVKRANLHARSSQDS